MKQSSEKLESLESLDTLQELHDGQAVVYSGRCGAWAKAVNRTCVDRNTLVNLTLHNNLSQGLSKVRG